MSELALIEQRLAAVERELSEMKSRVASRDEPTVRSRLTCAAVTSSSNGPPTAMSS